MKYHSLVFLLALAAAPLGWACTGGATTLPANVSFGSHSAQQVATNQLTPNGTAPAAHFSISCSVVLTLGLLSTGGWVSYTTTQDLVLSNGSDTIGYILGSNNTFSPSITGAGQTIGGPTGFTLLTLGILSSGNLQIPLHVRTVTSTGWLSPGNYTGTQVLTLQGNICTGLGIGSICLGWSPVSGSVTMNLSLQVAKSCELVSSPALIDFGTISFIEDAGTLQFSAQVRCSNTEDYLVYVDNGNHFADGVRHLQSIDNRRIRYGVYHTDNLSRALDVTDPDSRAGSGSTQTLTYPIRIFPNQPSPYSGTYSDNLRLIIEY